MARVRTDSADERAAYLAEARAWADLAVEARDRYAALIDAAVATHGDGDGLLISGVYRDHFPEDVKDELRKAARRIAKAWDESAWYWRKAGRRMGTWRRDVLR